MDKNIQHEMGIRISYVGKRKAKGFEKFGGPCEVLSL